MRIVQLLLAVTYLGITASSAMAAQNPDSVISDFLIQDVCITDTGQVTGDDPATCARHRDLRIGELVPYIRTDLEYSKHRYQAFISYPTVGLGGRFMIQTAKDFGGRDRSAAFRDNEPDRDGFDLAELTGKYASFVATQDPSGGLQYFWSKSCHTSYPQRLDDSWILFPTDIDSPNQHGSTTTFLRIAPACPPSFDTAYTAWHYVPRGAITYTSGKTLDTITSHHFGGDSNSADHFEQFYFTREYGFTRWERWELTTTGKSPKTWGCNGSAYVTAFNRSFVRTDCRDVSNVVTHTIPFAPWGFSPPKTLVSMQNRVHAGDFARGASWQWQAIAARLTTRANEARNFYGLVDLESSVGSIFQDADVTDLRGVQTLKWGALLASIGGAGQAAVVVWLFDPEGRVVQRLSPTRVSPTDALRSTTNSTAVDFGGGGKIARARLEFYLKKTKPSATRYMIDEAFLIAFPQNAK